MTQSWEHRRGVGPVAWLLILAAVSSGCGGARSPLPVAASRSASSPSTPAPSPSAGPLPSQVALESLRMITTQVGWAVAVDHNGYPLAVVRTIDGGRVWREAGPPGLRGQGLQAAFDSARVA